MKLLRFLPPVALAMGSVVAISQMPPPPPAPGAPPRMEGPTGPGAGLPGGMERREMRRIIVRGEDGPHRMRLGGGPHGNGLAEVLGLDPRPLERMADALDLTPQQRGKLTELAATARPEMRKLMQSITAESRRLRNLDPSDSKYATESNDAARKLGELTTRLVQQNADLRAKTWQVLTPEQRGKASAMRDRMKDGRKIRIMEMRKGGEGAPPASFLLEEDTVVDPT